jgi:predicted dehydrogenase
MMFFLGCHLVDLILQFQGVPEKIIPFNTCSGFDGVTANDIGMAVFQYKNGISFAKSAATECCGFMRRQLVISGSKGTIEIKPLERLHGGDLVSTVLVEHYADANGTCPWTREGRRILSEPYSRYECMLLTFAAMVRGEVQNAFTPAYERSLHRLVMQACGVVADG